MLVPWMEREKVALSYEAKLYLCHMWNVRSWFYATNPHNVWAADRMLEGGLVWYQARLYLCHKHNVKKWLCEPIQNRLLLWTEC